MIRFFRSMLLPLLLLAAVVLEAADGRVTAQALNLRAKPDTKSPVVGRAVKGEVLTVYREVNGWYEVSLPATVEAWISAGLVKNNKVASNANLRSGPGTSHASLGVLAAGTPLTILSRQNGWAKVRVPNPGSLRAYASARYINASGTVPASGGAAVSRSATAAKPRINGLAARNGIVVYHVGSGQVLYEQHADRPVAIASLTKMMTLLVALDELERRSDVTLDTKVPISKSAAGVAPTKAGLVPGKSITVRELLSSMIIKSCNDSAALTAEFFGGGSADYFIYKMNQKARALGMKSTTFYNPHGLPGASAELDNRSTPNDLVKLARAFMQRKLARQWVNTKSVKITNGLAQPKVLNGHNNLLGKNGVDGIKTGYTNRAGFCIATHANTASGEYIIIATGFPKAATRDSVVAQLLKWARNR